jgi:hypothetical protein
MNQETAPQRLLHRIARPSECLVGLVFLTSALFKAWGITKFAMQIEAYQVLPEKTMLPFAAMATLGLELILGGLLLMALRLRGFTLACTQLLLILFTLLIMYAWVFHGLEDCGCFGPMEISPLKSIFKNLVLMALVLIAWAGNDVHAMPSKTRLRITMLLIFSALVWSYAFFTVEEFTDTPTLKVDTPQEVKDDEGEAPPPEGEEEPPFAQFVLTSDEETVDLGKGAHLVAILSMDCEECMEKTRELDDLFYVSDLPPLVALCYEAQEGDLDDFQAITQTEVPLHIVEMMQYFSLKGKQTFGLFYITDGWPIHFWDGDVPPLEEVYDVVDGAISPESELDVD